ncbi:MAG TPA: Verru_Chthon cassette protein B [Candidatus Methylacidiphilales bacterium]
MKTSARLRRHRQPGEGAFTLVEVVMALGMVVTTLVPLVGLLAVGLSTFHDAVNATTESQILQQIAGQIELGSFTNSAAARYYFTSEGMATNAAAAFYTAEVPPPAKFAVPGGTSTGNTVTYVVSIRSKSAPKTTHAWPLFIANSGQ